MFIASGLVKAMPDETVGKLLETKLLSALVSIDADMDNILVTGLIGMLLSSIFFVFYIITALLIPLFAVILFVLLTAVSLVSPILFVILFMISKLAGFIIYQLNGDDRLRSI